MVKRYYVSYYGAHASADGKYVEFDDYAELENKVERLEVLVECLEHELRAIRSDY